jgi:hypothetical protein
MAINAATTQAYELKHQYYDFVLTYQTITADWSVTQNQNMSSLPNTLLYYKFSESCLAA